VKYFLAKTDPGTYSIDQFEREKKTVSDGVQDPRALRAISEMRPGDRVFLYHSGGSEPFGSKKVPAGYPSRIYAPVGSRTHG